MSRAYFRRRHAASRTDRHPNLCRAVRNCWRSHSVTRNPGLIKRDEVREGEGSESVGGYRVAAAGDRRDRVRLRSDQDWLGSWPDGGVVAMSH